MKALVAALCLLLFGCATRVAPLTKAETERFAVVEVDCESWVAHYSHGELAYLSKIDGKAEQDYASRRTAKSSADGPRIQYLFLNPGSHKLALGYGINKMGFVGRNYWHAEVEVVVDLAPGRYFVRRKVEDEFVNLWIANEQGVAVTEVGRAMIKRVHAQIPIFIAVPR